MTGSGGSVVSIFLAPRAGAPMQSKTRARAVPERGLEGDRYFAATGLFSGTTVRGREETELTLIELEVIDELNRLGVALRPCETRRNIVTEGVCLNELVGRAFAVGNVGLLGVSLCEPCAYLVKSSGDRRLLRSLVHRGGLRAKILSEGTIDVGDEIGDTAPEQLVPRSREPLVMAL
jgi:MOSC domain-containing protein YiiM